MYKTVAPVQFLDYYRLCLSVERPVSDMEPLSSVSSVKTGHNTRFGKQRLITHQTNRQRLCSQECSVLQIHRLKLFLATYILYWSTSDLIHLSPNGRKMHYEPPCPCVWRHTSVVRRSRGWCLFSSSWQDTTNTTAKQRKGVARMCSWASLMESTACVLTVMRSP